MGQRTFNKPAGGPGDGGADVKRVVNFVLQSAIRANATDIHIHRTNEAEVAEPYQIRLRVNDSLAPLKTQFSSDIFPNLLSRFKIMADMDSQKLMRPADGQFEFVDPESKVNYTFRLSFIPQGDYEECVIRLQRGDQKYSLESILMTAQMKGHFQDVMARKHGMVLINGPAGSGKTTTIYSLLSHIASPRKKIITAEDPIETRIEHVNHLQVSEQMSFADLSRSFLRQNADVIFIGEIRDEDSARIAVQLAQTGHLVLSTLHTMDSVGVIPRLQALGVHHTYIAEALLASVAQRLVPGLCEECREIDTPTEEQLFLSQRIFNPPEDAQFFKAGAGCNQCQGVTNSVNPGIKGMIPILELFQPDAELSQMISKNAHSHEIRSVALHKGMKTIAQEALLRVYAGFLGFDQVMGSIINSSALGALGVGSHIESSEAA